MNDIAARVSAEELLKFCSSVFVAAGLPSEDAALSATVLVRADLRGIPSHGVGRMGRYIRGLDSRQMIPGIKEELIRETPVGIVVDANGGMGFPVSCRTMSKVIEKAEKTGLAWGCVRNSNHFGIAGFYSMMALEHDMIGVAMTNTAALGVPTFGRDVRFGTNPMSFCAPAGKHRPFVLDMATTGVTRGKLEVYQRLQKPLPDGWAVDADGMPAKDAGRVLDDMLSRKGGGLLPLGGLGELFGGHKGYGLAVMVDILCALLADAPTGSDVFDTPETSARVSHCFGALKISAFTDPGRFKENMDHLINDLHSTPPAKNCDQVYYAGEKEFENEAFNQIHGVPLDGKTLESLLALSKRFQIPFPEQKTNKEEE